jgi:hypothetical protein
MGSDISDEKMPPWDAQLSDDDFGDDKNLPVRDNALCWQSACSAGPQAPWAHAPQPCCGCPQV